MVGNVSNFLFAFILYIDTIWIDGIVGVHTINFAVTPFVLAPFAMPYCRGVAAFRCGHTDMRTYETGASGGALSISGRKIHCTFVYEVLLPVANKVFSLFSFPDYQLYSFQFEPETKR